MHTHTGSVVRSLEFAVGTVLLETAGHSDESGAGWMDKLRTC